MAAPTALADNGYDKQKAALDAKLEAAQATIARTRTRESRLSSQIAILNGRISDLEAREFRLNLRWKLQARTRRASLFRPRQRR